MSDTLPAAVIEAIGHTPRDEKLFLSAMTHSSHAGESYQRLEFLGDRVLGLVMGEWLFELFPNEPEGKLSRRLNALVSGDTCAEIARDLDLGRHLRLGKQARDDGAQHSSYVLGDIVEALIGALFVETGLDGARAFVRRAWGDRVHLDKAPKHPKAELQEFAAAKQWRPPVYEIASRSGPHHAPKFVVTVAIPGRAAAEGQGTSKQEAETEAARALLEELK
ncbi:ribonuclease III [uncultured Sphingomonas sp.]|uniref:ribonuclease III n=1 Tax=uncultured Sphingomonas sp. TaxID=158754 RepID=UPI002631F6A5|nr:ribonuclease III [uncultured Sphingomonas sp.]